MAEDVCVGTIHANQLQGQKMNGLCATPTCLDGRRSACHHFASEATRLLLDDPALSCFGRSVLQLQRITRVSANKPRLITCELYFRVTSALLGRQSLAYSTCHHDNDSVTCGPEGEHDSWHNSKSRQDSIGALLKQLAVQALDKLRNNLEQGQPYDGQQMFKTIYHRLRAQKKLNDSYKLLEEGACLQLQEGQFTCGVELAQMLVEVCAGALAVDMIA